MKRSYGCPNHPKERLLFAKDSVVVFLHKNKCSKTKKKENNFIRGTGSHGVTCLFLLYYTQLRRGGMDMRRYSLASPEHKQNVDLRDYEDVIVEAVMEAMKDVEGVSVMVYGPAYVCGHPKPQTVCSSACAL